MNLLRTAFLITVAALAVAIAPAGLAANPTPAWFKALEARSEALSQQCVGPTLSREAFRALCGNAGAQYQPTRAELKALDSRGQALSHLCDDGNAMSVAGYRALCGSSARVVTLAAPGAPSPSGFEWGDFGIGAGAMFGLILLTGGIATAVHYGRRSSTRPRTAS